MLLPLSTAEGALVLTPEEISSRQFLISLRGYDRDEVQTFLQDVAQDFAQLQRRIRELEDQIHAARSYPATASQDQSASSAVPAREGPTNTRDAFRALGEETTRVLVAAEESAQEIRRRAEDRARHDLEQARREAREEVQSARRTAGKIVVDAERRRDAIADDVRELEAVRDELMQDLREAMKGVQAAVRRMASSAAADEVAEGDELGRAVVPPAVAPTAVATSEPVEDDDEDVVIDQEHVDPNTTTAVALEGDREDAEAVAAAVAAVPSTDEIDVEEALEIASAPPAVVEDHATEALEEEPAGEEAAGPEPATDESLDELATAQSAIEVEEPAEIADATDVEPVTDEAPTPTADPIELRTASLSGIRPGMLRRLKRALQDVQNTVLDAIRRNEGQGEARDLVPSEDDYAPLAEVANMFLTAAYRAGLVDGAELAGQELPDDAGDESRVPASAATFQAVLTHEITSSLTATLRAGLEAGEPETSLSERVGGVFRDLKGPVIESAVDEHLTRVYGYGALDLWEELGAAETKLWVTGDEPRCPANQCRTNASEGPVSLRETFPSGDQVPPAHDACVCAVAPA